MNSFALIIFGITSNLAQIKLIPALYDLAKKGLIPKNTSIIGIARSQKSKEEFQEYFHQTLHLENKHHKHTIDSEVVGSLLPKLFYLDGHLDDPKLFLKLKGLLKKLGINNKIFYLATYPDLYEVTFKNLKENGLSKQTSGWSRLMIEKPIGTNLSSAQKLNKLLLKYFQEEQIFRLDHYLGKETLQNILTFRFGNSIFEPLLNSDYIDSIQVTALEDFGIGQRGGYYDSVGALKDVGQNHLLQMLVFATMDAPNKFSNFDITKSRIKILENLVPYPDCLVLGQYLGYQKEKKVTVRSQTDTYFAFKTEVKNRRLAGVPIYVRGGKKLKVTATEVSIIFKTPTNRLFTRLGGNPNILTFRIEPNEGIGVKILTKKAGHKLILKEDFLQFCYFKDKQDIPDAYERLLLDAIEGDATFFNDSEEVELQWRFIDAIFKSKPKVFKYLPGSFGPDEANKMISKDQRSWLTPAENFCVI